MNIEKIKEIFYVAKIFGKPEIVHDNYIVFQEKGLTSIMYKNEKRYYFNGIAFTCFKFFQSEIEAYFERARNV